MIYWRSISRKPIDKFESASYKISIDHFGFAGCYDDDIVDWAFRCPKNHSKERAVRGTRAYEIFLGGHQGTTSGIRDVRGSLAKIEHMESDILSPDEWRPFWIRISPNGLIEVGKKIGSLAFMSWKAELPVDYYSVASYNDGTVDWAIECPKRKLRSEYVYIMK
ncbi:lysozyme [Sarracenia purpurea var. burkii]